MHRETGTGNSGGYKPLLALLAAAFVVTVSIIIASRLSKDAIAVLTGVAAGVGAGIPTALLLIAVTRRREDEWVEPYDDAPKSAPPVIVVTPGTPPQPQMPYYAPYSLPTVSPRRQRHFRVMGEDEQDDEFVEESALDPSWPV